MHLIWFGLALIIGAAAMALPYAPGAAGLLAPVPPGDAQFAALLAAALLAVFGAITFRKTRASPARYVLIDGSNVMHWNSKRQNGAANIDMVRQVAQALEQTGHKALVIFDANAGYKLADRYLNDTALARMLALSPAQVMVVPKGRQADEYLLRAARDKQAPIVTNDRFRDWQDQFPELHDPDRLIHGGSKNGTAYLRRSRWKA